MIDPSVPATPEYRIGKIGLILAQNCTCPYDQRERTAAALYEWLDEYCSPKIHARCERYADKLLERADEAERKLREAKQAEKHLLAHEKYNQKELSKVQDRLAKIESQIESSRLIRFAFWLDKWRKKIAR